MTTPSTGDAMGESLPDEVVEAVAKAINFDLAGIERDARISELTCHEISEMARAAIRAYQKATREAT